MLLLTNFKTYESLVKSKSSAIYPLISHGIFVVANFALTVQISFEVQRRSDRANAMKVSSEWMKSETTSQSKIK